MKVSWSRQYLIEWVNGKYLTLLCALSAALCSFFSRSLALRADMMKAGANGHSIDALSHAKSSSG